MESTLDEYSSIEYTALIQLTVSTQVTEFIKFSDIVEENGRTIRDNNLDLEHNIPIGAKVRVSIRKEYLDGTFLMGTVIMYVLTHDRDCDGTPLYGLGIRSQSELENAGVHFSHKNWAQCHLVQYSHGHSEEALTVVR